MVTTQPLRLDRAARPPRKPATALTVCAWELRRHLANRMTPLLGVAVVLFFAATAAFKHEWLVPISDSRHIYMTVYASTAWGALYQVVAVLVTFFGMLVPFLTADAVARDQKQRVHELLMTTPLVSGAYVWGRFLAALLSSLVAVVLAALAVLAVNLGLNAAQPGYPPPNVGSLALSWLVTAVPAVVLLGGTSFLIGTVYPRLAMVVKLAMVLLWIALIFVVDIGHGLGWFAYWTPTSNGILKVLLPQLVAGASGGAPDAAAMLRAQGQLPDLWPWAGPHIALVLIGLLAVAIAAASFHRFRKHLNA